MNQHASTSPSTNETLTQDEAAAVERGLADVAAGRTISWTAVKAWLHELEHTPGTPMPPYD